MLILERSNLIIIQKVRLHETYFDKQEQMNS